MKDLTELPHIITDEISREIEIVYKQYHGPLAYFGMLVLAWIGIKLLFKIINFIRGILASLCRTDLLKFGTWAGNIKNIRFDFL